MRNVLDRLLTAGEARSVADALERAGFVVRREFAGRTGFEISWALGGSAKVRRQIREIIRATIEGNVR